MQNQQHNFRNNATTAHFSLMLVKVHKSVLSLIQFFKQFIHKYCSIAFPQNYEQQSMIASSNELPSNHEQQQIITSSANKLLPDYERQSSTASDKFIHI